MNILAEIRNLLKKEVRKVPDENICQLAATWDLTEWQVSPRLVACVYSYLTHKYKDGETLTDIERNLGLAKDGISHCMRALEEHGYLAISRAQRPFRYRVIK